MAALRSRCGHYIFVLFLSSFFPHLISAVADWMSTILLHMVRTQGELKQVWNVLHSTRWKYRTQKPTKKLPSRHHCTNLSGSIFATKACIDNRKKLVKQQYPHTCPNQPVQPFLHSSQQKVHILTMGCPSPKIAPCHGVSGHLSNTWFPGPTWVLNPNSISIGSAVFAGLTSVTERQTGRQTMLLSR